MCEYVLPRNSRVHRPYENERITCAGFRTNVASARALRRRLFVERDALPFGERIEAALHAASMEEPLLPAIITDEAEAAITHEPFDSACRHSALLRSRSCSTIPANFCHLAPAFTEASGARDPAFRRKKRALRLVPRMQRRCTMPVRSIESGGGLYG